MPPEPEIQTAYDKDTGRVYIRNRNGGIEKRDPKDAEILLARGEAEPVTFEDAVDYNRMERLEEKAGTGEAVAYGAAKGLSAGLFDLIVDPKSPEAEVYRSIAQAHPVADLGGEVAGTLMPFAGPLKGMRLATAPGLFDAAGQLVTRAAAPEAAGAMRTIGGRALGLGLEGGLYGTAQQVRQSHIEDTPLTAEKLGFGFLAGALPGAVLGVPIGGIEAVAKGLGGRYAAKGKKLRDSVTKPGVSEEDFLAINERELGAPGLIDRVQAERLGIDPRLMKVAKDPGEIGANWRREAGPEGEQMRHAAEADVEQAFNHMADAEDAAIAEWSGRLKREHVERMVPEERFSDVDVEEILARTMDRGDDAVTRGGAAYQGNVANDVTRNIEIVSETVESLAKTNPEAATALKNSLATTDDGLREAVRASLEAQDNGSAEAIAKFLKSARKEGKNRFDFNLWTRLNQSKNATPEQVAAWQDELTGLQARLELEPGNYGLQERVSTLRAQIDAASSNGVEDLVGILTREGASPEGEGVITHFANREFERLRGNAAPRAADAADAATAAPGRAEAATAATRKPVAATPEMETVEGVTRARSLAPTADPLPTANFDGVRLPAAKPEPPPIPPRGQAPWRREVSQELDKILNELDDLKRVPHGVFPAKAKHLSDLDELLTNVRMKVAKGKRWEAAIEIDYLKKRVGKMAAAKEWPSIDDPLLGRLRDWHERLRSNLENGRIWGQEFTDMQRDMNALVHKRIRRADVFWDTLFSKAGTDAPGNPWAGLTRADRAKIRAMIGRSLNPENARELQGVLDHVREGKQLVALMKRYFKTERVEGPQLKAWELASDQAETSINRAVELARRQEQWKQITGGPGLGVANASARGLAGYFLGGPLGAAAGIAVGGLLNPGAMVRNRAVLERVARGTESRIAQGVAGLVSGKKTLKVPKGGVVGLPTLFWEGHPDRRAVEYVATLDDLAAALEPGRVEAMLAPIGGVAAFVPNAVSAAAEAYRKAIRVVLAKAPARPTLSPFGDKELPYLSDSELEDWEDTFRGALDPIGVLEAALEGSLTPAMVDAADEAAPALMDQIRQLAIAAIAEKGNAIEYDRKVQVSVLLKVPLDATMTPDYIQTIQLVHRSMFQQGIGTRSRRTFDETGVNGQYASKGDKLEAQEPPQ